MISTHIHYTYFGTSNLEFFEDFLKIFCTPNLLNRKVHKDFLTKNSQEVSNSMNKAKINCFI